MAEQPEKKETPHPGRWTNVSNSSGTAKEIVRSASTLRERVAKEQRVFTVNSLVDGGKKSK